MYDLVIRGGTVVDGTGGAVRTADVAIDGSCIVDVGHVDGSARQVIDADGLLVTPGFVDMHTHFDGQATWDPHLTPSCWHGVTTAILGNCGVGFAPVRPGARRQLVELMEGVEDIPGTALYEGNELETMQKILQSSIEAGALGFSTGRTRGHRDVNGSPVPGTFAPVEELVALADAMSAAGRGVFQVVPAGIGGVVGGDPEGSMEVELRWMADLADRTHNPVTFLVMESNVDADAWRPWFETAHRVNAAGGHLRPQVASRCFGVLLGHQSRMNPFRYSPTYDALAALPHAERISRLREPGIRSSILDEAPQSNRSSTTLDRVTTAVFANLFALGGELEYEPTADRSVAAVAARAGRDPWATMYDLLLGADGQEFLLLPLLNYAGGSYDGLHDMMLDPVSVQGLGDGGAHSAIVCDASMTTYLLTHWVRDRTRGPRLPLEYAVKRLTKDAAELYGLSDRGVLTPGMRADVNVIDLEQLHLRYPERVADLPGGAGRLIQRSDGYVATLVAGEIVVDQGELTDARPGTLVRGASAAP